MTPERKEYIDNITLRERVIRNQIKGLCSSISTLKNRIRHYPNIKTDEERASMLEEDKITIALFKKVLILLKKQLPKKRLMQKKKIKPLPCPFCGGKAKLYKCLFTESAKLFVFCEDCGARLRDALPTGKEAIEAWNRRAGQ